MGRNCESSLSNCSDCLASLRLLCSQIRLIFLNNASCNICLTCNCCPGEFSDEENSDIRTNSEEDGNQENGGDCLMQHVSGDEISIDSLPGQIRESGYFKPDQVDSFLNEESETFSSVDETNGRFWEPPEPEDYEDDVEGRVSDYDDDDDVTIWGKPTSLSDFGDEIGPSCKFNVEKEKAMNDLMNGKFKSLVGQLLNSADVHLSKKDGLRWIDVITSISWEAAKFVRQGFTEGKSMDPDVYVKIKCVATGSPQQSHVIKGLVFKKHAAHKHMPTKYKNPRLLLIEGSLGLSTSGLSSFESLQQENNSLKEISTVLENYQPNVVLVEKTVSWDIQESILAKGVTLVFDMKLHRLERISRCTGSPILSSNKLIGQKLWQCDSFEIIKFDEEIVFPDEGGKKPCKTLMFLEGCPTRLGCTILLMGANSDQLKKIKCALRCAVVMAHNFILETYFLLDLKAMFSTMPIRQALNLALNNQDVVTTKYNPLSNGSNVESSQHLNSDWEVDSSFSFGPYNHVFLSGLSSVKRVMSDNFSLFSLNYLVMPVYFGDNERQSDTQISISSQEVDEQNKSPSDSISVDNNELLDTKNDDTGETEDHVDKKDDITAVLDAESILVLMSSQNASRMTLCEHSHFSHIKFYRNFDIPLGNFLRENLLNQNLRCKTCSESPEAHFYHYAHHNKQLTIQVRRLPVEKSLPGETEGKLWMWGRCGRCKSSLTLKKSTRRVLISKAARGLSFGKFLELSFSNPSTFGTKSNCGHSLHKDFLYFFGLGTMVGMFKFSRVATYSVRLPSSELDFVNSTNGALQKSEFEKVYLAGISLFLKVEKKMEEFRPRFEGLSLNLLEKVREFSYVEDVLVQERSRFEVDIEDASKDKNGDTTIFKLVRLNRLRLELFLMSYIWDRRLHCLSTTKVVDNRDQSSQNELPVSENAIENGARTCNAASENPREENLVRQNLDKVYPINMEAECSTMELKPSRSMKSQKKSFFSLESESEWVWAPYIEIWREYVKDICRGYLPKFESLTTLDLDNNTREVIINEGSRLHIPLCKDDYVVSDFEDEFSSIISCALALLKDVQSGNHELDSSQSITRLTSVSSNNSLDSVGSYTSTATSSQESHFSGFDGSDFLDSLVSSMHPEVSMGIGKSSRKRKYSVVCIYATQFRLLRNRSGSESGYIASLSRCRSWNAKGGKSNSVFCKTLDDRFIIKEVQKIEFDSFMKFAPNFFEYMNECYELGNQTCLAKILGIYQVLIKSSKTGKDSRHNLMVMENLSFGRAIVRQYDLKGALYARFVSNGNGAEDVLLDQNFVNDMNLSPLYVSRKSKRHLQRAVWNDVTFLNSINVMDYSLLVGVDESRHELVCGIIDYVRQYTWDKQLETWAKISFVGRKNHLPTIISPIEYKKRFRKFIDTHFLSVPEHWCSQRSYNLCRLCDMGEDDGDDDDDDDDDDDVESSISRSHEKAHVDNQVSNASGGV